ncbi:MAG: rRNA methyltransferase [Ectothiorhodospiraceae bacterium]|nr:rRNA methyltransferase [Ectothiorhodospiraceae bacterium]
MRRSPSLTTLAHALITEVIAPGDTVLDATMGNGHDTAFLVSRVRPGGTVWALDIQAQAVAATRRRLGLIHDCRVELRCMGHENLSTLDTGPLRAAMFNLGYLPGADHGTTTRPATTCTALDAVRDRLLPGGRCTVMAYTGHPGGAEEARQVAAWCQALPSAEWDWRLANPPGTPETAPRLFVISRAERAA